jgi:outer membrane autotransporter protein
VSAGVSLLDSSHTNILTLASQSLTMASVATTGAVVVSGWNSLNLTSNTSATVAGNLALAGSSSTLSIDSSSWLKQSADAVAITANSVKNAGTVAIGSSQALTISGNYTQTSTGVLQIGIGSTASGYGKLLVSGDAIFAPGANLSLTSGALSVDRTYKLVSATGVVSGLLSTTSSVYRNISYRLVNTGSGIDLVAGAATGSTTPTPFINGGQANATLNLAQATTQVIRDRMARMDGKAYYGTDQDNQTWVAPYANQAKQSGLGNGAGAYTQGAAGLAMGIDIPISESNIRVGAALLTQGGSLSGTSNATQDGQSSTGYQLGLYAKALVAQDTYVSVLANAGFVSASTSRLDSLGNTGLKASAKQHASYNLVEAQLDRDLSLGSHKVSPLVKLNYGYAKINSYSESGASISDLAVGAQSTRNLIAAAGAKYRFDIDANSKLVARFSLGHDFNAQSSALIATDGLSTSFTTYSVNPGSTVKEAGVSYEVTRADGKQVRIGYDYYGRNGYNNSMINVKLMIPFD